MHIQEFIVDPSQIIMPEMSDCPDCRIMGKEIRWLACQDIVHELDGEGTMANITGQGNK
jgi:hypothetical protein